MQRHVLETFEQNGVWIFETDPEAQQWMPKGLKVLYCRRRYEQIDETSDQTLPLPTVSEQSIDNYRGGQLAVIGVEVPPNRIKGLLRISFPVISAPEFSSDDVLEIVVMPYATSSANSISEQSNVRCLAFSFSPISSNCSRSRFSNHLSAYSTTSDSSSK